MLELYNNSEISKLQESLDNMNSGRDYLTDAGKNINNDLNLNIIAKGLNINRNIIMVEIDSEKKKNIYQGYRQQLQP